ncbi:MAG: NTP transferase domain-containing protein [Gammaproteobacteria bacterium]|nr:NTP transferase domain-containing protein [Gammaproteobacteria bacterium]
MSMLGVVLIGGRSTRMGRDKALMPYAGRPAHEILAARLSEAGCGRVLLAGRLDGLDGIPDEADLAGPLAGIAAAARAALPGETHVLIVPVDMPALGVAPLKALCDKPPASAACYGEYFLPAVLRLGPELDAALAAAKLPDAPRSVRNLLKVLGAEYLDASAWPESGFGNANTPEEWGRLEQVLRGVE